MIGRHRTALLDVSLALPCLPSSDQAAALAIKGGLPGDMREAVGL